MHKINIVDCETLPLSVKQNWPEPEQSAACRQSGERLAALCPLPRALSPFSPASPARGCPAGRSAGSQGLPRGALPHCADEEAARGQGRDLASLPWLPRFGRCKLPVSFSRGLRGLFPSLPVRSWSLPRRLMSSQVLVKTA